MQYVALLRGINVGGNNIIKMADLRSHFEKMGFEEVRTYIQSGNVLFNTDEKGTKKLEAKLEKELGKRFGYTSTVVLISKKELEYTVKHAPKGFGTKPDMYRYDVIFLKPPLTPKQAEEALDAKEGVDTKHAGKYVVYFRRLIAKASQSRLSKIVGAPIYKQTTIRNWNTTTKLLDLMKS